MMKGIYRFAQLNIEVETTYPLFHRLCAEYIAETGSPDFTVRVTEKDLQAEIRRREEHPVLKDEPFSWENHEILAAFRQISDGMPFYDRLLLHGSCIAVDGKAYLFTADSGTGKSTHTRLWRERFGDRAVMVNDDKPFLHITTEEVRAYGSPWDGKHRLSTNIDFPLKGLCILRRGEENRIRRIRPEEAWPELVAQCHRATSPEAMVRTMGLLDTMMHTVGVYLLECNMDPEAAEVSYLGMNDEEKNYATE